MLDQINATLEFFAIIPLLFEIQYMWKVRSSAGVGMHVNICWLLYCVWSSFYYFQLSQIYTFAACWVWIIAYLVKLTTIYFFSKRNEG